MRHVTVDDLESGEELEEPKAIKARWEALKSFYGNSA
jgi:hypothetical protein